MKSFLCSLITILIILSLGETTRAQYWNRTAPNLSPTTLTDNVGIGESVPTEKLHVKQSSSTLLGLRIQNTLGEAGLNLQPYNGNQWKVSSDGSGFGLYDYGSSAYRLKIINSTGNVGIGTTSPGTKLDINGTLRANNNISLWNGTTTLLNFTSGVSYFNGGNVGIGTTSPGTKLDINGTLRANNNISLWNGTTTLLNFTSGVSYFNGGNVGIGTTTPGAKLDINGTFRTNNNISLWNGTTNLLNFTSTISYFNGGNVGIGTTSPGAKLDINGTLRTNNNISLVNGSTTYLNLTSGISYFNGGNVGIGITNPQQKLDVSGNIRLNSKAYFNGVNGDVYIEGYPDGGEDSGLKFYTYEHADLVMSMCMTGEGKVGIGKIPNEIYHLDVNGKIRANEVVVNTTGADFVFDDNYNFRSISEVETFIKENKHLPEIPNAEEMQKDGMSLSEMNTKLLQKVEELTLYIIDQEKRIKNLEDKNEK